jgi:hypothetical protein
MVLSNLRWSWRKRILIIVLWILSLAVSVFLITAFITPFFSGLSPHSLFSLDWSGYVVASDFENPQPLVSGVNASWTVPKVTISQKDTFCSTWVGIGGQTDETLIQAGTEQDSVNGKDTYFAWYELLPYDAVQVSTIKVSAGDRIIASINLIDSNTNEWLIKNR